jgi:hypothetical protein
MARAHGTRSAYNAGCRCDACREASRSARARQRDAVRSLGHDDGREDATGRGGLLILVALVLLIAGGVNLWGASDLLTDEESTAGQGHTRRGWILGAILTSAGVASLIIAVRE